MSDVAAQLKLTTLDRWESSEHSLCEEPFGDREAGESRPL